MAVQLWVGLGNPGPEHALDRHNVGFMGVDAIARAHGFAPFRQKHRGWLSEGRIGPSRLLLLKPATYMNDSGRSVRAAVDFYKLGVEDVTVFHDELDLAPFRVKVKRGGGAAGHNGLRSIGAHLGDDYRRVRLGIGHPGHKDRVTPHVLGAFAKAEHEPLAELLGALAAEAPLLAAGEDARFVNEVRLRTAEAA